MQMAEDKRRMEEAYFQRSTFRKETEKSDSRNKDSGVDNIAGNLTDTESKSPPPDDGEGSYENYSDGYSGSYSSGSGSDYYDYTET
jgi:hypothetical protein